jgi:hypothetical protein
LHRSYLNWNRATSALAALLLLATGASSRRAGSPVAKTGPPKSLPENLVTTWKKAGAEVGWMQFYPADFNSGLPGFAGEKEPKHGDLPAFRFPGWQEGHLAKLPAPEAAFGLSLSSTPVTDAGLRELGKSLPGCRINR